MEILTKQEVVDLIKNNLGIDVRLGYDVEKNITITVSISFGDEVIQVETDYICTDELFNAKI